MTFQNCNNWISVTITPTFMWKSEITCTAALSQTVYDTKFELICIKYAKVTTMVCQPRYTVFLGWRSAPKNFISTNNKIIIACPFNFQTQEGSFSAWGCLTVGQTQHGSRKWFINMRQFFYKLTSKILLYYVRKDA